MATLATRQQLANWMQTDVSDVQADLVLAAASAVVRGYTGQQFAAATSTVRVRVGRDGRVRLPQRPVTAVTTVTTDGGVAVTHTWYGDMVDVSGALWPDQWGNGSGSWQRYVNVAYSHGYAVIPDDIVGVVCQIAARVLTSGTDRPGLTSETIAGYSYSLGPAAAAGATGLMNDEKAVLDRYKPVLGAIWMS